MSKKKMVFIGIGIFILIIGLVFVLELLDLGFFKFFAPKRENIRREVFENTKSYTHGKIQDLAKYFEEYMKTEDLIEKNAIKELVKMRFAEFDETKIRSDKLRGFLITMRGY